MDQAKPSKHPDAPSKAMLRTGLILPATSLLSALALCIAYHFFPLASIETTFWVMVGLWLASTVLSLSNVFRPGVTPKARIAQVLPLIATVVATAAVTFGCTQGALLAGTAVIGVSMVLHFLMIALSAASMLAIPTMGLAFTMSTAPFVMKKPLIIHNSQEVQTDAMNCTPSDNEFGS